jgi:hypothetical protein
VEDAVVLLGLGRSQLDELIRSGRLQTGQTDTSPDLSENLEDEITERLGQLGHHQFRRMLEKLLDAE